MTKPYIAFIRGRIPGMCGSTLVDIYAASNLITLTSMVRARGLSTGEFVLYDRNWA